MDSNKDNASGSQVWHADTDPNANTGITCCEIEKEHRWCTYVPSQFGRITKQRRISGESLLMRSTETWSPTERRNGTDQHQRRDLGFLCLRQWRQRFYEENLRTSKQDQSFVQRHAEVDPRSRTWNIWNIHDWNSMDEKYLVAWRCCQVIDSESLRLLGFGTLSGRQSCWISTICTVLQEQNWVVLTKSSVSWAGQY